MKLISVVAKEKGTAFNLRGMNNHAYTFATNPINLNAAADYDNALKTVDTVFCEDRDVDAVVESMSLSFPNVDIVVYDATAVYVRAPGVLKTKSITKNGVLPT